MRKQYLRKTAIIIFWILVWQFLAMTVDNRILLVTPVEATKVLGTLLMQGMFWKIVAASFGRIAAGFVLGVGAAWLMAALAYRRKWIAELLHPLMSLMKTVPVVSFVVLLLIWWGSSFLAVAISFLVVVPGIYFNTLEGLGNTDKALLEMAEVYEIRGINRFVYIYRPALQPFVSSGLQMALGMCWKSGVAAEIIGTPAFSIGERLYLSKIYLDTAGVLAWTGVIILCSMIFERLVLGVVKRFFCWSPMPKKKTGKYIKGVARSASEDAEQCPGGAECDRKEAFLPRGTIQCDRVCKAYGELVVQEEFTAFYDTASVSYLRGASGSGKTTLLRMICGLELPDSGAIGCGGVVRMMFQEDRLCEEATALQNVALVTDGAEVAREALLQLLDAEALCKPVRELSGGMRRRVALVRAMEAKSDVILLDEPYTGMDEETRREAEKYILRRQQGRTLLIASHI